MTRKMIPSPSKRYSLEAKFTTGFILGLVGMGLIIPAGESIRPESTSVTATIISEPVVSAYQQQETPKLQEKFDVRLADGTIQKVLVREGWIDRLDADIGEVVTLWKAIDAPGNELTDQDTGLRASPEQFDKRGVDNVPFVILSISMLSLSLGFLINTMITESREGQKKREIAEFKTSSLPEAISVPKTQSKNEKQTDAPRVATSFQVAVEQVRLTKTRHDKVLLAYGEYECSALEVFSRPALADVSEPATAVFLRALDRADSARALSDGAGRGNSVETACRYDDTVVDLSQAWREADANASRVGQSHYSYAESKRLRMACLLLKQAQGCESGSHEQAVFAEKARQTAKDIVVLTRKAMIALDAVATKKALLAWNCELIA